MKYENGYLKLNATDKRNFNGALMTLEQDLGTRNDKDADARALKNYKFLCKLFAKLNSNRGI